MKKSEVDEFLNGLNGDNNDPFNPENVDPFTTDSEKVEEKVEEKKEEETEKDDTDNLPFHKNPKVQRYVQKEIAKALENATPKEQVQFQKEIKNSEDEDDLIAAFTNIIGNDTPEKVHALKMLDRTIKGVEEKAAQRAMQEFSVREQMEKEAEKQAVQELENGFESIEETFNVDITSNTPLAKKTRNEFIDFVKRIAPKDSEGQITQYPDFEQAFTVFQETRKSAPAPNRAKELADRSMTRSGDASTAKPQEVSWKSIDKLFSGFNK